MFPNLNLITNFSKVKFVIAPILCTHFNFKVLRMAIFLEIGPKKNIEEYRVQLSLTGGPYDSHCHPLN